MSAIAGIMASNGRRRVSIVISADRSNYTLNTLAVPGYGRGSTDVELVINSNVSIYSTSYLNPALTISAFNSGDTITIINNGTIQGTGGAGGSASAFRLVPGSRGGNGGPAIDIRFSITIQNNGTIAGGGGGGGGGGHGNWSDGINFAGGAGGAGGGKIIGSGAVGLSNSVNSSTTTGSNGTAGYIQPAYPGNSGAGIGGGPSVAGTNGGNHTTGGAGSGGGGGGGGLGADGGAGGTGSSVSGPPYTAGGLGGTAGKAVNLNGYTVTWLATGTRYGTVS